MSRWVSDREWGEKREHALIMDTQYELNELNSDVLVMRKGENTIPRCLRNEYVSVP